MNTIALRFGETFSPKEGTIQAHMSVINTHGFVWYGKLGSALSDKVKKEILSNEQPRILLIHSGSNKRYWAYVEDISRNKPNLDYVPDYYHHLADNVKAWLKITKIEKAENGVLAKCFVRSSGVQLSFVSQHSMSPYFIITYKENLEDNHE